MTSVFAARFPKTSAGSGIPKVMVRKRTDVILVSTKEYDNPYRDVDVDAFFTHEDGTEIHLYGFWNGGSEWRVRFSPTKTGTWSYVITCSDGSNSSLSGVTGKILAVENNGATDVDRHGFIKIADCGRYFVHEDGTPFYWLGDTNWQAPNYVSVTECNYPGCTCGNQFKHEVDDRLAKGFTVYQTYFDSAESDGGGQRLTTKEPGLWINRYDVPDVETFSTKIDAMFDYLADKGMVIALGYGVHLSTVQAMGTEALDRFSRYLTARYASYPVVWITAQEITGEEQFDAWVSSARIVAAGDGYGHPHSAHQYPIGADNEFVISLNKETWHTFYALQGGHGALIPSKSVYEGYWKSKDRNGHPKPFIETEANYEDIMCGAFNGYDASRISAWKANLCGSYGFTYGATGVWANNYSTAGNTGWLGSYSFEPWYMGIDKPGSFEMKYMADFFRYVDFSRLIPRFNDKKYSDLTDENKLVSSSQNADTYVAYFYNNDYSTGELRGLDPGMNYSAKWYDTLTGCFVEIDGKIEVSPDGRFVLPEKPTNGDWALLVTSRGDLGEYPVEAPYSDELLVRSKDAESEVGYYNRTRANILSDAVAEASSTSAESSSAERSIDGNFGTWWCASDGSFPQSLTFTLPEERTFNTFSMNLYCGTLTASYVLEVSSDGKNWTQLSKHVKEPAQAYGSSSLFICSLEEEHTCRYLRVIFEDVSGNWAAVLDAAAYVSRARNKIPEYEGTLKTPAVRCSGSFVYSADGKSFDTVGALFDGDENTLWTPYAPIGTQTILMDLGGTERLYGINIKVGDNAVVPPYRIEGSVDGVTWTILANAALREKAVFSAGGKRVVSEALSGDFRYVKLLWLNVGSNDADKSIAEIELYADETSSGKPYETEQPTDNEGTGKGDKDADKPSGTRAPYLIALGCAAAFALPCLAVAAAAAISEAAKKRKYNGAETKQKNVGDKNV